MTTAREALEMAAEICRNLTREFDEKHPMFAAGCHRCEEEILALRSSEQKEHRACPSHCCPTHGCKYGHDDCPVFTGKVKPTYPNNNGCELCEPDPSSEKPERFEPDDATRAKVAQAIDKHPLIASLLYDIDLLPEQIKDERRYGYMLAVIGHMKEAQSASGEAVELLRLWAKRLEYSDPHGDYPKVAAVLRRFDTEEK